MTSSAGLRLVAGYAAIRPNLVDSRNSSVIKDQHCWIAQSPAFLAGYVQFVPRQSMNGIRGAYAQPEKFCSSISLFVFSLLLSAQTGTSTIRGTITDPSGGVISGATVTLTNTQTNAVRTVTSGDTGSYVFDLITPSTYRVTVEATGFKKKVLDNVQALIGKPTTADIALEVGAVNEVVEVRSSAQEALVNTQDATLGNNFSSLQITQLALGGTQRGRFAQLAAWLRPARAM